MKGRHGSWLTADRIWRMVRPFAIAISLLPSAMTELGCRRAPQPAQARARNLVLITIDTLRADHVGAYGYARSQAAAVDEVAAAGVRFEHAYATAPITLPSHATLLTGRYPPGHGSRDNGMRVNANVPTIATELKAHGFRTAAFVAAFPLDHQFGLARGFDVYGDRLPRAPNGQLTNERPASDVVNDAIAWLGTTPRSPIPPMPNPQSPIPPTPNPQSPIPPTPNPQSPIPFFLWVHVFEPHAPYGDAADRRPVLERYDQEIGTANRELQRLLRALEPTSSDTLTIVAGDHGEAFGEHGEFAHSIFVYDTTLRVPLVMRGPGIRATASTETRPTIAEPVTLADVAPTALRMLGFTMPNVDGVDLSPLLAGGTLPAREIYAESFAPLVEFGWAPLRAIRSGAWKLIAAPNPELFDVSADGAEAKNVAADQREVVQRLESRANRYSAADLSSPGAAPDGAAADRLRALGYTSGNPQSQSAIDRPDPKDRREMAARIAQITSGELGGAALVAALEGLVRDDPRNAQAHLRLGIARLQTGDCARAEPELHAAAAAGLPSADIYVGLATCLGRRNDLAGAERALAEARRLEPENAAVLANIGILRAAQGNQAAAIESLMAALARDPDLHEARFNLALAYARAGRRADAAAAARDLLARLPPSAPQRPEVERLLRALQ
jgi:choline-sulfatase